MSTIKGFGSTDIKPQPGFTATRSKEGGWVGSHNFAILRTSWSSLKSNFAKGTSITSLDSDLDSSWEFLKIVEPRVTSEEGDFIFVETTLAGGAAAQFDDGDLSPDAEATYRLNGQLQDAPLSMHQKWAALSDLEKGGLGLLMRGQAEYDLPTFKVGTFNPATGVFTATKDSTDADLVMTAEDAKSFALLIARGETTYLRPTFTWTESTQGTNELTSAQINKLGRIATPRGNPPEPSGTRDWMLTGAFQEERGELITTELEWTLSERGGHNEFLYEDA